MTDLGPLARAYLTGRCGDNPALANAVIRVLFLRHPYREVASQEKVAARTLQRKVAAVRMGLKMLVTSGQVDVVDLMAKE